MMKTLFLLLIMIILCSCDQKKETLSAQDIIDKAIVTACNGNCNQATIEFIFRGRQYISNRNNGEYQFERITTDSLGTTRDVLTNSGFKRFRNDTLIQVPDSMAVKYSNSVNSVHYFAQLPYGLNNSSVQKKLLGIDTINGERYHEIGVSFKEDGGGSDFEDIFVYWIHSEKFTIDYLAYQYSVNGGGIRFREAFNIRMVNGIRFADYQNYRPDDLNVELTDLDDLFLEGKLTLLSTIETEEVDVSSKSPSD